MTNFFGALFSFILLYKYTALFCIALLGALAVPVPATTTLAAASAFASQGYLSFPAVLALAWLGNVVGDLTGYLLVRRYGESLLERTALRKLIHSSKYNQVKDYILRFPQTLICVSRFLSVLGPVVNLLAGLSEVPVRTFVLFDLAGEASYVVLYGFLGYTLGAQWDNSLGFFFRSALVLLPIAVAINLLQVLFYRRRSPRS